MSTFAPYNSCGSIPNTKLVKYLARQKDVKLTLIAYTPLPHEPQDPKLLPKEMELIRTFRVQQSPFFLKTLGRTQKAITDSGVKQKMKAARRPLQAWIVSKLKHAFIYSRTRDWARNAIRIIRKELKDEHFDIVYSSYPSYESHLAAHYVQKNHIADRWVADFRDPIAYMGFDKYGYKRSLRRQHRIERWADSITVVSEGAMDKFRFPDVPEAKLSYVPNGYDPEDFSVNTQSGTEQGQVLRLFYAGMLYEGRRDLSVLFQAIAELIEAGEIRRDRVQVEYAGSEWSVLCGFADRYGLSGICKQYGYIPRTRVMEIMAGVDITLVCSTNTAADRGVVTGKLFELLLAEKPILTIVNGDLPDSELGQIVRDCCAGVVFEQATAQRDYPLLKQWLLDAYQSKQRSGAVPSTLCREKREQYSYAHIAERLMAIFAAPDSGT